jgi:hypothetical protein
VPKLTSVEQVIETEKAEFSPEQQQFFQNLLKTGYSSHGFCGGGGAGKTYSLVRAAQELAVGIPENLVIVTRKTSKDLKATTYEEFMDTIHPALVHKVLKQDFIVELKSLNGTISKVDFSGMDDRSRWGSRKAGQILNDEANELDVHDYNFQKTRLRHGLNQNLDYSHSPFCFKRPDPTNQRPWLWDMLRFIVNIFNPPENFDHWLRKWWLEATVLGKPEKRTVVRASSYSNRKNLPPQYLEVLESLSPASQARMLYGEDSVGERGDPAVEGFDPDIHGFDGPIPQEAEVVYRGLDPGWHHPAMYFGYLEANVLWIFAEAFGTKIYQEDFIKQQVKPIEALLNPDTEYRDFIDHQKAEHHDEKAKETNRQQLKRLFGYNMRSKYSTPELRAKLWNRLLKELRVRVHIKNCPVLTRALQGGWYRDDHGDLVKDGYFDNAADGAGYMLWGAFGKRGVHGKDLASPEGSPYRATPKEGVDDLIEKVKSFQRHKEKPNLKSYFGGGGRR